jgi:hypothetical protein
MPLHCLYTLLVQSNAFVLRCRVKPRMAQNIVNTIPVSDVTKIQYYMSGDPDTPAHWLTMVSVVVDDGFTVYDSPSQTVDVTMTIYERCDRRSCMGCKPAALMSLCYAMQQCIVVNCIGTVVNQNSPMCNIGLSLQSEANKLISLAHGAWLLVVETYANILEVSLSGSSAVSLAYIDDAFFGFICAAKDQGGQVAAILTSTIGMALNQQTRSIDPNGASSRLLDTKTSARNNIILTGVNAFLYQASLYPLYELLAIHKIVSCNTKNVAGLISVSGFEIVIGRPDWDNASDIVAGSCMTSYMEEESAAGVTDSSTATAALSRTGTPHIN